MSLSPRCAQSHSDRLVCNVLLLIRTERTLSRDFIFELYLNETYFGRRVYGVAAAAKAYFAKPLTDLTAGEAAFVAVLPRAPTLIRGNLARVTERRNFVIDRMQHAGSLSAAEAESAKQQPLLLQAAGP
jgi:penicillin-binding protein 1A